MNAIEELDALVIGAGLTGIAAGHHLQTETPWASYAIVEARSAIGGTWDLFRYPGIRSDSDMFTLGYPFRPWDSDRAIGDGATIRDYIQETAEAEGIDKKIRFNHKVVSAEWSSDDARWTVEVDNDGTPVTFRCRFIVSCTGYYRYDRGHQPDFPGMEDFQGRWVHPQQWPEDLDYRNKSVVVIGSGATAITLIPSMAQDVEKITMLQRSPTYVAALPTVSPAAKLFRKVLPKEKAGAATRWVHAVGTQGMYQFCRRFPKFSRKALVKGMAQRLPKGFDVATHFTPKYDPWDQRLCLAPNGDFFKAIRNGKADVVTDEVASITDTGVRLRSGREIDADIIVSATGLELLFLGGIKVTVDGQAVDVSERMIWKGMMLQGVPNMVIGFGYTNASWTLKANMSCQYAGRLLNELERQGLRQATPTADSSIEAEPMLGLSSGYIQRAQGRVPLQGDRAPWRVYQSYLKDYRAMQMAPVVDEGLKLSNPTPAKVASAA